jgi:tRNA threonylcarbamoyladenosine biosynthesis protein TsaE
VIGSEERIERVHSGSPEETEAIAARLAAGLRPGSVVMVIGDLGAGKTVFVRGAARALGVIEPVTSPTFTIGRRYDGDVPVSHLDLYRLAEVEAGPPGGAGDLGDEDAGLVEDYLTPDAIAFIEWPRVASGLVPDPDAVVEIDLGPGGGREIAITARRAGRE